MGTTQGFMIYGISEFISRMIMIINLTLASPCIIIQFNKSSNQKQQFHKFIT